MKNIFNLPLVFLILQGCTTYCVENHFAIVNLSGKDVEITSYRDQLDHKWTLSNKFIVANDNRYEKTLKDCGNDATKFNFGAFMEGDSIVIDYGDRSKGYSNYKNSVSDPRNPYLLNRQNNSDDFVYTLTPEDYANATPKP